MTPKEQAAMRQALEALEELHYSSGTVVAAKKYEIATAALREALAEQAECPHSVDDGACKECYMEQAEQEPVAWGKFTKDCIAVSDDQFDGAIPLYTAPVKSICYQEAYDALAAQLIKNPTGAGMDQLAQNNGLVMAMNTLQHILNEEKNRG